MAKPARVLLVEDNPADIRLFQLACADCFRQADIQVAKDGEIALEQIRDRRPQLVILDLNLPKLNGFQVLDTLKADEQLRSIPVIVFSSSQSNLDVVRSYAEGASCFIRKPQDFLAFEEVCASMANLWMKIASLPPA